MNLAEKYKRRMKPLPVLRTAGSQVVSLALKSNKCPSKILNDPAPLEAKIGMSGKSDVFVFGAKLTGQCNSLYVKLSPQRTLMTPLFKSKADSVKGTW